MSEVNIYLWVLPFLYGLLLFIAGLYWLAFGEPFDRLTYEKILSLEWNEYKMRASDNTNRFQSALIRFTGGNSSIILGIFTMGISFFCFRTLQTLAWYFFWVLPLHAFIDLAILLKYNAYMRKSLMWDSFIMVTMITVLLVTRKSFAV